MSVFEKAKDYYNRGLWTIDMLKALVKKGKLTEEEYEEIVETNNSIIE